MLAESAIRQAIQNGRITLKYWNFGEDVAIGTPADLSDSGAWATQQFESDLFGSRVSLRLGPLVLSHNRRWKKGHHRFKTFPGVFDLRKSGGRYTVSPGESLTVNAAQSVRIDGSLTVIVLPRLTHATAGIVLSPSYIDPLWDGVPVLHLTNTSRQPYEVRINEKFGNMYFFENSGNTVGSGFRERFISKSHHYGLNWSRILNDDADPYPMRKTAQPPLITSILSRDGVEALTRRYGRSLVAGGVSLGLIAIVIFSAGAAMERLSHLGQTLNNVQVQLDRRSDTSLVFDISAIVVAEGETEARERISLLEVPSNGIALANIRRGPFASVARAELAGQSIVITVELAEPAPSGGHAVEVGWLAG